MKRLLIVLLALLTLSACVRSVDGYNSDPYIVSILGTFSNKKIRIDPFEATLSGSGINQCRGYSIITTPGEGGLVQYIQDAFISELELARLYSPDSPIILKGYVSQISLSTLTNGEWILKMTLASNNGRSISAQETLHFKTNIVGQSACQVASDMYSYAVQNLIRKLVMHPNFKLLLEPSTYPKPKKKTPNKTKQTNQTDSPASFIENDETDTIEIFLQQQNHQKP